MSPAEWAVRRMNGGVETVETHPDYAASKPGVAYRVLETGYDWAKLSIGGRAVYVPLWGLDL